MNVIDLVLSLTKSVKDGTITGNEYVGVCSITKDNGMISIRPVMDLCVEDSVPYENGIVVLFPCLIEELSHSDGTPFRREYTNERNN